MNNATIMLAGKPHHGEVIRTGGRYVTFQLDNGSAMLTTDNNRGTTWLPGVHAFDSPEVLAMCAAYALDTPAEYPGITFEVPL